MYVSIGISGGGQLRASKTLRDKKHTGQYKIGMELYIFDNKGLFDQLHDQKGEIEAALGYQLDWRRLDDKKASRIILFEDGPETEDAEIDWFIKRAEEFGVAFRQFSD